MRVAVSPELSAFIAARVAGYPTEAPERLRWASSFVADFSALPLYMGWTETIGIRPDGEIAHRDGATLVPGLYALGFRLLRKRDSHFIGGVGSDAVAIAEHIAALLDRAARRAA